jgi:hypothetical protein
MTAIYRVSRYGARAAHVYIAEWIASQLRALASRLESWAWVQDYERCERIHWSAAHE